MHTIIRIISIIFLTLTINFAYAKNDKLTIGLDWFINPDHAPLIIAQKRGFFKEVGLEVEMIEPADPNDPPKLVAAGKLDLAISYQPQLHIQVDQGLPVVRVGTLVSVPLNSLVVLKDGPIKSIADLKGKKIGFSVGGFEEALLSGMLQKYNLKMSDVELININFSLSPSLIAKKVDAVIGAFRNFELNQMDIVNHPGLAFYPEEHGVPSYEELIYISNTKNRNNPIFNKFFKAIQKATLTIVNDPQSTWEDFSSFRKGLDDELNKRAYRDTLSRFALRPQAHDLNTYKEFGVFLKEKGIIKKTIQVEKFAKP
jgi:putative hydroxymethylpyrimidine transport system substrate-binding protein